MTTTNTKDTKNYTNKRVLIKSKEHLDYVIEQTKMVIDHETIRLKMYLYLDLSKSLMICFEEGFDNDKDDWFYESLSSKYGHEYNPEYSNETLRMDEIFIDLPPENDQNAQDSTSDKSLNGLWLEYVASISESLSEIKSRDLAKDFYRFATNKMKK